MVELTQTNPEILSYLEGFGVELPNIHAVGGRWPCTIIWTSLRQKTAIVEPNGLYDLFIPTRPITLEEITGAFGRRKFKYRSGMVGFSLAQEAFSINWEGTLESYTFLFEAETLKSASQICFEEPFESLKWRSAKADFVPAIHYLGLDIAIQAASNFPAGQAHVEAQIITLLSMIFRRYSTTDTRSTETVGLQSRPVLRAIHFINANLGTTLTLSKISQKGGASITHMRRLFRAEMGHSVWSYVQQQRLNAAAHLLLGTDLKISQIGQKCGYPDSKNFSRQFRTQYKFSPEQYRNTHSDQSR